ncbi:MAG TPA: Ig-like domain-containing protein [Candidatus Eremiobacteraceae bacterium]|nr:Ig-like domain-containing protein [Candidatus Eremiobacteraceae bacterium]
MDPQLPGRFRFLTPRMVGFQQDEALPLAARVRITLKAGLADLNGHTLAHDLSWTFTTAPIDITGLPQIGGDQGPLDLNPTLRFRSNVELDQTSLADHLSLITMRGKTSVPVSVALDSTETPAPGDEDQPQYKYDASTRNYVYKVIPKQALAKKTEYALTIAAGVRPARGNLASGHDFSGSFVTFSALEFDGLDRDPNQVSRFVGGRPLLSFNNGLVADSVQKNLSISPTPRSTAGLFEVSDGDNNVYINPSWLTPTTKYTITIGPGVTDKFGQTLGKQAQATLSTGDFTSNFWTPEGLNIFPADNNLQLDIAYVNLHEKQYKAVYKSVQPRDLVYWDAANPDNSGVGLLPSTDSWPVVRVNANRNDVVTTAVPLRDKLGGRTGMLAYGATAVTEQSSPYQQFFGLVQLTNLGVFAQWFPTQGLVRVQHLSDGSRVSGARIEIYPSRLYLSADQRTPVSACATGTTDETGTFWLSGDAMAGCIKGNIGDYGGPALLAVAREGADWSFARTTSYSGLYGYNIRSGWDKGNPQSRGAIYSDRQLYQPAEKAWLTGAAYFLQNGVLRQDRNARYDVTLEGPSGQKSDLGSQTTDAYGMFSLELALKANQPLGYYTVRAKGPNGVTIAGDFRVAEFKPPNFKVTLALDKDIAYPGDTVTASATSEYLFGSPVQGGQATYYVTRQQTSYSPKGWDDFSFGRQWFWPERPPTTSSDVLQKLQTLGPSGKVDEQVKVDADIPYPMSYRVDAQVVDVSNLSVADSKSFTVLPADALIGLQNDWVVTAGKALPVKVIVTDPKGAPLRRRSVKLSLQLMQYASATQLVEGGQADQNAVQYKTVATAQIDSADSPQTVSLTPTDSGPYRIRANFADAKDDASASDTEIWVTGPGEVDWGAFDRNMLQVKLDKTSYHVGDTATALIQSPYPKGELYFAVVRNRVLYHQIVTVSGGAPEVHFRVSADMLPNAAIEAVLVRQGKPLAHVQPGSLDSLARTGFAPFTINLDDKYLKVSLSPAQATLEPESRQTVRLQLRDAHGKPTRGEAAVMVVNETILQLTGYRPPDLVQAVYAQQPISTVFADNRPDVVLQQIPSPLQKGWGYGGGFMAGAAGTRVRTNFQPIAYYDGALHTDANGNAQFTFITPDDLTTWRVMAVAVAATDSATGNGFRFGNSDATFIVSKALVTNALLPQFAHPGDKMQAGLTATSISGGQGTININGMLSGPLAFDQNGSTSQSTTFSGTLGAQTQAFRFPMVATDTGMATVTFRSTLGPRGDAFEVPLEVRPPLSVMEQVIESGVTENSVAIPVNVAPNVVNDSGGLELDLASTLLPTIVVPVMKEFGDVDLPILEPIASRLLVSADLKVFANRYGQIKGLDSAKSAAASLTQLRRLQQADGGFAWIPQFHTSDPFMTVYAGEAVGAVQSAGIHVDPAMISGVKAYLERSLPDAAHVCLGTEPCTSRLRLDILMTLSDLGEARTDFLSDIYDVRTQFDLLGQVKLARYLLQFPAWRQQANDMATKLQEIVYVTGRYATINYPEEWGWLESPTAMRAQVLRLFVERHADPELLDKLVSSLLALRHNGVWRNTYEDAEALTALLDYGALQPQPPNFSATAKIGASALQSVTFSGYKVTTSQRSVPMAALPRNKNDLVLSKSGQGQLHYLVAYSYRLAGNRPGILNGLRITRFVREATKDDVLGKMGLNAPNDPLTLGPGQIFDIDLEVITDHPVDHVVITDELPAGLEAVDTSFKTSTPYFATSDSWEIDYQTIYKDRVVAYATRLEAGIYSMHYLVRSVTPGTYLWPGGEVHLQYAPEEFGRTSSSTLIVSDK